jgi:hypothetical protein
VSGGGFTDKLQLHFDFRMLARELRDQRRHVAAAEAQRRVHAQQAARLGLRLAQQLRHVVDRAEDAARMFHIELALGREAHAPRGAVHQRDADARLHLREPLAHGRRADAQLARCRAQAAAGRKGREEAEFGGLDRRNHGRSDC